MKADVDTFINTGEQINYFETQNFRNNAQFRS